MAGTPVSQYGKDWRINVGDGAGSETFVPIAGETSFDWTRTSDDVDLSSKDDGYLKASGYGQQSITFKVSGNVKLPDAGLQRISDVAKLQPPETDWKVMNGAIVKYSGQIGIGNFSCTFGKDGSATYSFDAKATAVPTVDNLGAAA